MKIKMENLNEFYIKKLEQQVEQLQAELATVTAGKVTIVKEKFYPADKELIDKHQADKEQLREWANKSACVMASFISASALPDSTAWGEIAVEAARLLNTSIASTDSSNWLAEHDAEMEKRKDDAYLERNRVVAALAKLFPSGIAKTAIEGWSEDWHSCVYIDLPTGQVSWHYHDSHAFLFAGLQPYRGKWDGHSTEEKYDRLAQLQVNWLAEQKAQWRREVLKQVLRLESPDEYDYMVVLSSDIRRLAESTKAETDSLQNPAGKY